MSQVRMIKALYECCDRISHSERPVSTDYQPIHLQLHLRSSQPAAGCSCVWSSDLPTDPSSATPNFKLCTSVTTRSIRLRPRENSFSMNNQPIHVLANALDVRLSLLPVARVFGAVT